MRLIDADALWHEMETAEWYNNADRDEVAEPLILSSQTIGKLSAYELATSIEELLKAQEQEISRLKHHIDCNAAEKIPSGCVGYGRGFNDDEPCETCKSCEKYNGYGEE